MKLRYYLRGLGIGILVTALILGIAGGKDNRMSDAQIRARAAELGMVDGSSTVLGNRPKSSDPESDEMQPTTEGDESSTEGQAEAQGKNTQFDGEMSEEDEPQITVETQSADEPESGSALSQLPEVPDDADDTQTVSFTIRSGEGSYSISQGLQQSGLVEDASVFDTYLNENGYSRRLRAGTFLIPVGTGMEEIARIITGG